MTFYVGQTSLTKDGDIFSPNIQSSVTQAESEQTRDLPRKPQFLF